MSARFPNRPQNLFRNNTNDHAFTTNPPPRDTSVEPSLLSVLDRTAALSDLRLSSRIQITVMKYDLQ